MSSSFFYGIHAQIRVVDAAREIIDELRREILSGEREDTAGKRTN